MLRPLTHRHPTLPHLHTPSSPGSHTPIPTHIRGGVGGGGGVRGSGLVFAKDMRCCSSSHEALHRDCMLRGGVWGCTDVGVVRGAGVWSI
jgi:hypothetical protein